ncbi:MAG: RsmD family RNA methyltransferase [Thermodesulfobacteriota bacterium]
MRIIAGELRGRRLLPIASAMPVRPTADRAREAIFSILGQRVRSARVLDLFAGTGAMGIEALSRGAAFCLFVDRSRDCAAYICKNLERFGLREKSAVCAHDAARGMGFLARSVPEPGKEVPRRKPTANVCPLAPSAAGPLPGFDLVFADPPYDTDVLSGVLASLAEPGVLNPDALICCEHPCGKHPAAPGLFLADSRRYGKACFSFFSKEEEGK